MENMAGILESQKSFYRSGKTRDLGFRQAALRRLEKLICEAEEDMLTALAHDLGKPLFEGYSTDIAPILGDIKFMQKNLPRLARPQKVRTPLALAGGSSRVIPQPLGIVLVMAPWNYPFQLLFRPLIGALAAGNCVILKPSEHAPACSAVSRRLIEAAFSPEYVTLIEGGAEEGAALLQHKFNCIFFTGGSRMGRTIMEAAARHLTPTILELGGKSPCIVEPDVNLKLCARRITWGKFLNAGQTCVAPDYLLVDARIKDALMAEMQQAITSFYGVNPQESPDYARIINHIHFNRLSRLMDSGHILYGGQTDREKLYIAPTLMEKVSWDDPIMGEEIFGPLLPVLEYQDLNQALDIINEHPHPLALYLFSQDQRIQEMVLQKTTSGGVCLNDTVSHLLPHGLPFGGVGESGKGAYHGEDSFFCFSHRRSVFKNSTALDLKQKYPPYRLSLNKIKALLRLT
jgi:acyl-CoA reductase-like NAD-dependent aldehyde dehydrogenase